MEQLEIFFNESTNEMVIKNCENCRWSFKDDYSLSRCKLCHDGYSQFQPLPTAAELFEEFFKAGYYPQMKILGLANGNPPHFNGADESERCSVSPSWGCLEQPFSV